jgi:hypothetical protein
MKPSSAYLSASQPWFQASTTMGQNVAGLLIDFVAAAARFDLRERGNSSRERRSP